MTETESVSKKSDSILQMALNVLVSLLFAFLVCYLGVTYWQSSQRRSKLKEQLEEHRARLETIQRRKKLLSEKNRLLRDNEYAVEYLLRQKYGLLKPDEYRIIESNRAAP